MFLGKEMLGELMHDSVTAYLRDEMNKGIKLGCEPDMHNLMAGLLEFCYKHAFPSLRLIVNVREQSLEFEPLTKDGEIYPVAKKLKLHNTEIHLIYIK